MNLHGFTQTMKAGGVTLGIILACSVLGLAVGIERIAALWKVLARALTGAASGERELKLRAEEFGELLKEQKPDPRSKSGEHRALEGAPAVVKPTPTEA